VWGREAAVSGLALKQAWHRGKSAAIHWVQRDIYA
jgi:hypothetical protein